MWFRLISVLTNVFLGPLLLFLALAAGVATVVCGAVFDWLADRAQESSVIGVGRDALGDRIGCRDPRRALLVAGTADMVGGIVFYVLRCVASLLLPSGRAAVVIRVTDGSGSGRPSRSSWQPVNRRWTKGASKQLSSMLVTEHLCDLAVRRRRCLAVRLRTAGQRFSGSSRDIDVSLWSAGRDAFQRRRSYRMPMRIISTDCRACCAASRSIGSSHHRACLDEPEPALEAFAKRSTTPVPSSASWLAARPDDLQRSSGLRAASAAAASWREVTTPTVWCCGSTVVEKQLLILPGDLEPPGTRLLSQVSRGHQLADVLMAPHHGSLADGRASSVLQWSRPRETIVSGGQRARRPEVTQMLSATGSGVHVTSQVGAIRTVIDRQGNIEVRSWSESPW